LPLEFVRRLTLDGHNRPLEGAGLEQVSMLDLQPEIVSPAQRKLTISDVVDVQRSGHEDHVEIVADPQGPLRFLHPVRARGACR
jgi:hypothetical protein